MGLDIDVSSDALRQHFERHIAKISASWPPAPEAQWERAFLDRLRDKELASVSTLAAAELSNSLAHRVGRTTSLLRPDLCICISTFACTLDEARLTEYPLGYLDYLTSSLRAHPDLHYVHFQFGHDARRTSWSQITFVPNKNVLGFAARITLPIDLLTPGERERIGLDAAGRKVSTRTVARQPSIGEVLVFLTDLSGGWGGKGATVMPPATLFPKADEACQLKGQLLHWVEKHSIEPRWVEKMSTDEWRAFWKREFPGKEVRAFQAQSSFTQYTVAVLMRES